MTVWSHLPNAAHIDRVIQSVKSHPEAWAEAQDAAWAGRRAAWDTVWHAVWDAARDTAWVAARNAARDTAWDAVLALIAYDDAAKYLDMSSDKLQVWAILSEDPAAVLLSPAVIAYERISELETV